MYRRWIDIKFNYPVLFDSMSAMPTDIKEKKNTWNNPPSHTIFGNEAGIILKFHSV